MTFQEWLNKWRLEFSMGWGYDDTSLCHKTDYTYGEGRDSQTTDCFVVELFEGLLTESLFANVQRMARSDFKRHALYYGEECLNELLFQVRNNADDI